MLTTLELATAIRERRISAVEALDVQLARIEKHNDALNAVVTLDGDGAVKRAREADRALARGEVFGPLHGVPFLLKDAHATSGMRTTTGSPAFDHVPGEDGTVAARLKAAGAILVGKTNVAEMLADYQTDNPIFGRTNNPWDLTRTSGGSSGGAAAAVATGMTPFDVGTDLSASIRIPAHFCGVFGLKPTERRVSLVGVVPDPRNAPRPVRIMSSCGPLARSVDDLELLYTILAGPDGRDTDVAPVPIDPIPEVDLENLRVAFAETFPQIPVSTEIRNGIRDLARELDRAGAIVEEASVPPVDLSKAGELIGMITGGRAALADYNAALDVRDRAIAAWETFFDTCDVLLCPPCMTTAFPHCESGAPLDVDGEKVTYWLVSAHATMFNYTGHPAAVLPYKLDRNGLPIGVQLVTKRWSDSRLLGAARAISAITGEFRPPAAAF